MPKFIVTKREVWTHGVEVEADNSVHAIDLVGEGEGEDIDGLFEYSHTMKPDYWTVEKNNEDA